MGKVREWNPVSDKKPELMQDVLICSKDGEIFKAFRNLGHIWIMQNTNSLPSWYYREEKSVLAWMELPKVYKKYSREGWTPVSKALPDVYTPVLISTEDAVYISHVRSGDSDMWWMRNRNENGSDSVYLFKSRVLAWMPLPEVFQVA